MNAVDWDAHHSTQRLKGPYEQVEYWAQNIPAGGRVLDIGCGVGHNAVWLLSRGFKVTACDQSQVAVQRTRREGLKAHWCGAENLFFADDAEFDAALMWGVFSYLFPSDIVKSLAEIARVLKPSGLFLCATRTTDDGRNNGQVPDVEKGVLMTFLSRAQIAQMWESAGLSIVSCERLRIPRSITVDDDWIIQAVRR